MQSAHRMHNIHEVARHAGVSLGTVSNVLNHPDRVSDQTRGRVQRAIDELGFVRNGSARQLRDGSRQSIGLIVLDVSNPFFTEVARGVEDAASERGYIVILGNSDNSARKEERYLRILEEQRVAGVIIVPVGDNATYRQTQRRSGSAVVLLDRESQDVSMCSASVDDVYGGALVGQYLLARGHRRIAYVHGSLSTPQYMDRLAGLRRAVGEAGLAPDEAITPLAAEADNAQAGATCVASFLALDDRPTAIFCGNDYLAVGVMYELMRVGADIPHDVALIGYDDIELASMQAVPLTTIRQPKYDLGLAAARLLLGEIADDKSHVHQHVSFRPELIVRQSAG
jgi:LacI family transcriptional regulator